MRPSHQQPLDARTVLQLSFQPALKSGPPLARRRGLTAHQALSRCWRCFITIAKLGRSSPLAHRLTLQSGSRAYCEREQKRQSKGLIYLHLLQEGFELSSTFRTKLECLAIGLLGDGAHYTRTKTKKRDCHIPFVHQRLGRFNTSKALL